MKIVKVTDKNNLIFKASITKLADFDYHLIIWFNHPCNIEITGNVLLVSDSVNSAEIQLGNLNNYNLHFNKDNDTIKSIVMLDSMKTKLVTIVDSYKGN